MLKCKYKKEEINYIKNLPVSSHPKWRTRSVTSRRLRTALHHGQRLRGDGCCCCSVVQSLKCLSRHQTPYVITSDDPHIKQSTVQTSRDRLVTRCWSRLSVTSQVNVTPSVAVSTWRHLAQCHGSDETVRYVECHYFVRFVGARSCLVSQKIPYSVL